VVVYWSNQKRTTTTTTTTTTEIIGVVCRHHHPNYKSLPTITITIDEWKKKHRLIQVVSIVK